MSSIIRVSGQLTSFKLLSTSANPAQAVLEGLQKILGGVPGEQHPKAYDMIHGSTVATNALLERKGARTALVTTEGFGDVLADRATEPPLALRSFRYSPAPAGALRAALRGARAP